MEQHRPATPWEFLRNTAPRCELHRRKQYRLQVRFEEILPRGLGYGLNNAGFNVSSPSTRSSASPASTGTTFIPLPTTPTTTSPPPGISSGAAIVVQESNILLGVAVGIVVFNAL